MMLAAVFSINGRKRSARPTSESALSS